VNQSTAEGVGRPDPATCHPRKETLTYHGGDLVANADVFLLFWGPMWTSDPEHITTRTALEDLFTDLGSTGFPCALSEYALPAHPLNPSTFNGSYVLTSSPPNPLPDASIRAEIQHQIALGHAPSRTDDRVYIVVSEKGVVVDGGGETGCGGSNFTFCGYHDDFGTLVARYRYAILPYPCNSGGFTCFVGPTDDAPAALQAVGSHELAEIVTDPDSDALGGAGWFSDASGNENEDICADSGCTDTLTAGANTYTVNPTWSNLGRGCITTVPCSVSPDCTESAPGLCSPGTSHASRCALEWQVNPNLTIQKGLPTSKVTCTDGQPFCDFDDTANGSCTFHVAACLNSADPRVTCAQLPIQSIQLVEPNATSSDPTDQTNAATLLGGLQNADGNSTGTIVGSTVSYTPAATTVDSCTNFLDIIVPIGKRSFSLKTASGTTRLSNKLRLTCNP
jgi:hypothetical protein